MKLPSYLPALAIGLLLFYIPIFLTLVFSLSGPVYNPNIPRILYTHGAITATLALLVMFKNKPALGDGYWFLWVLLVAGDSFFVLLLFALLNDTEAPNWH
jgi:hypothetical protein